MSFAQDESGAWGYKVGGADTVIPFKSGGDEEEYRLALYNSLQFSGQVTEEMTFDEMCNVLSELYPEQIYFIQSSSVKIPSSIYYTNKGSNGSISLSSSGVLTNIAWVDPDEHGNFSYPNWTQGYIIFSGKSFIGKGQKVYCESNGHTSNVSENAYTKVDFNLYLRNVDTLEFTSLGSISSKGSYEFDIPNDGNSYYLAIYTQAYSWVSGVQSLNVYLTILSLLVE